MTLKVCAEPGCPVLLPQGTARCSRHARKPWAHAVPSRHARGYDAAHVRLRRQVLDEEPACAECGQPSTTMDHEIPIAERPDLRLERGNLRGLCRDCQQRKASREGARARA